MNARSFSRLRCVAFLAAVLAAPAEGDDLETPVLKHCPVDQWTATSFTADIQAAVPGATSYTLRYVHDEDDGTVVTGYVHDATFPCVVENLSTANYVYDVQAKDGATTSAWSNAESIDLRNYIAPTCAIPMTLTGVARGTYSQDFDGLIYSGSADWYDARTIAGWYAADSSGSLSDVKYSANDGGSSGTGLFSCKVDRPPLPAWPTSRSRARTPSSPARSSPCVGSLTPRTTTPPSASTTSPFPGSAPCRTTR